MIKIYFYRNKIKHHLFIQNIDSKSILFYILSLILYLKKINKFLSWLYINLLYHLYKNIKKPQ